jgi:Ulp1 family protease
MSNLHVATELKLCFQVPVQPNFDDCGIYMLHFVRVFLENPIDMINIMLGDEMAMTANKDPWQEWQIPTLRQELQGALQRHAVQNWIQGDVLDRVVVGGKEGSSGDVKLVPGWFEAPTMVSDSDSSADL